MSGFIEHKVVVVSGSSSWCTHCGKAWDYGDREPPECIPDVAVLSDIIKNKRQHKITPARPEVALIGFLTAKLACYEPDSPTVKRGLEYLKNA